MLKSRTMGWYLLGKWCPMGASAAADGYTVNGTPAAGAVVVFAAGQSVGGEWTADGTYGHVAYVESYDPASNTITISQGGMGFLHLQDQHSNNECIWLYLHSSLINRFNH